MLREARLPLTPLTPRIPLTVDGREPGSDAGCETAGVTGCEENARGGGKRELYAELIHWLVRC